MKYSWSKYNYVFHRRGSVLLYNTLTNALYSIDKEDLCNLRIDKSDIERENIAKWGIDGKFFVKNDIDERNAFIKSRKLGRKQNILDLYIYPTLKCNFSCPYCYQREFAKSSMNFSIMKQTEKFIINKIRKDDIKGVGITWIGGEPLVAQSIIKELYKGIKSEMRHEECKIENSIVTNGYLMDETTIKGLFAQLDIKRVQITIDGMEKVHNYRRNINNSDSFNIILANVERLLELRPDTVITFRCNIDKTNMNDFHLLYDLLRKTVHSNKIDVIPGFVENYSLRQNDQSNTLLSKEEQGRFLLDLFEEHGIKGRDFHPKVTTYSCMAKVENSLAIGPDGYVYKCATLVGQKEFAIFHIDTPEKLNKEFIKDFFETYDYLHDPECLECNFFPVCDGGCSIHRLREKYSLQPGEKCPASKLLLEEYLVNHIKERYNENV